MYIWNEENYFKIILYNKINNSKLNTRLYYLPPTDYVYLGVANHAQQFQKTESVVALQVACYNNI